MKSESEVYQKICHSCRELCPAFGGKPSACAKNIAYMKDLDKKGGVNSGTKTGR
jgi:hypothetical protein